MNMKKPLVVFSILALVLPAISYAATLIDVLTTIQNIIRLLVPIFITLALVYFIWGIAQFILESGNEEKRAEGKSKIIWGVIALFVIVSIWGLVGLIGATFQIGSGGTVEIPKLPGPSGDTTSKDSSGSVPQGGSSDCTAARNRCVAAGADNFSGGLERCMASSGC